MNRSNTIRHNARIILPQVRGKSKSERKQIYAILAGPLGIIAYLAAAIVAAQTKAKVEVRMTDEDADHIMRDFMRGTPVRLGQRFRL